MDLQQSIGPSPREIFESIDRQVLREENERLREALAYYAKPRTYGRGEHSVFIDDCGVAKAALGEKLA
jgi:hypothetical protein